MAASDLEREFATTWRMFCGFEMNPTTEHRFHPTRKWKFDFAWPEAKVAVEIEGGLYRKGRHTSVLGFVEDCDKYNAAAALDWAVIRLTEKHLKGSAFQSVQMVKELVLRRSLKNG